MALSVQNQNLITDEISIAADMRALQHRMVDLVARWNLNDAFTQLNDADIAALFPWLTKSEVSNGIAAFTAVTSALGDDVSGQATNLIKLKG